MTDLMILQIRYDLPPSLAKILLMLVNSQVVTARMIEIDHNLTKDAKVAVHRLRRRLADIEIKSRRDVGYWLESDAREAVREKLKSGQMESPSGDGGNSGVTAAA